MKNPNVIYIKNTRDDTQTDPSCGKPHPDLQYSIELFKVDICNKSHGLAGAVFDLLKFDCHTNCYILVRFNLVTDRHGHLLVTDLPAGKYKFVEKRPPRGYVLHGKNGWFIELPAISCNCCNCCCDHCKPVKLVVYNRKVDSSDHRCGCGCCCSCSHHNSYSKKKKKTYTI